MHITNSISQNIKRSEILLFDQFVLLFLVTTEVSSSTVKNSAVLTDSVSFAAITCGNPQLFPHSEVQLLNQTTLWNTKATYSCKTGYSFSPGTLMCRSQTECSVMTKSQVLHRIKNCETKCKMPLHIVQSFVAYYHSRVTLLLVASHIWPHEVVQDSEFSIL